MKQIKDRIFTYKHRVYFGDTDAAGVVYHARYIHWLEAARIELLDDINYPYIQLQKEKIGFIPVDIHIRYHAPLKFSEFFTITTQFDDINPASFTLKSDVKHEKKTCCSSVIKLACINESNWKPKKLPKDFLSILQKDL